MCIKWPFFAQFRCQKRQTFFQAIVCKAEQQTETPGRKRQRRRRTYLQGCYDS